MSKVWEEMRDWKGEFVRWQEIVRLMMGNGHGGRELNGKFVPHEDHDMTNGHELVQSHFNGADLMED